MKFKTIFFLAVFALTTIISQPVHAGVRISCSMYPVYDFARAVAHSSADVSLIIRPGTEPHEFEPSPRDIKTLNDSDVFIFTGKLMEQWAEKISSSLANTLVIDASEGIEFTGNDPHVWLDLSLAQKMIQNIALGLSRADPEHSQEYHRNADAYCAQLADLDAKFMTLPKNKTLVFAGEFSYAYFVKRYGFEYVSAYDGEHEPGVKRMAEIIRLIRANGAKYVLSDVPFTRVTRAISEQTGAKILPFSSAHNVQDTSRTFLEIMNDNFSHLAGILLND